MGDGDWGLGIRPSVSHRTKSGEQALLARGQLYWRGASIIGVGAESLLEEGVEVGVDFGVGRIVPKSD